MPELTPQQEVWMSALRTIAPKAKALGWTLPTDCEDKIDGDVWTFVLLDRHGHKHWLRVNGEGHLFFAPTTMVYRGTNQMVI